METDTFTLRIYITGLALFVPENEHTMHVLLPRTAPAENEVTESTSEHAHEHRHHDAAADGAGLSAHVHEARIYFRGGSVGFDGARWTPVRKQTPDARTSLPDAVTKITYGVDARHLAPGSQDDVAAHLILQTGSCQQVGATLDFDIGGVRHRNLTNSLCWTIPDVPGKALDLNFSPISGTGTGDTGLTLRPRDGIIVLHLMNVPEVEHTHQHRSRAQCDPRQRHHFFMYSVLFGGKPLPDVRCFPGVSATPANYTEELPGPGRREWAKAMAAKVIYTCMIAQANLE